MRPWLKARGTPATIVAALMLLVAGGGYALASGSGTINACVHKGTRTLYRTPCHKGDTKI